VAQRLGHSSLVPKVSKSRQLVCRVFQKLLRAGEDEGSEEEDWARPLAMKQPLPFMLIHRVTSHNSS